jgi:glycosyltransferase involved in cell wall biosynthesis
MDVGTEPPPCSSAVTTMVAQGLHGVRIAHLIESDGPGGAERMLASIATELQAAGMENVVIAPAGGEGWLARELSGTGVRMELFRHDRPVSPAFARWLVSALRRNRVEIAHSHEFTMAAYGAWAARRAGAAHLFTMHGSRYYAARWRRRIALRMAADMSGSVVSVSRTLGHDLSRDLWLNQARIITIPNGARPVSAAEISIRAELRLQESAQLAVAVGNLYPVKGHTFLVEALALLANRFPELHVAIAGRGDLDTTLRARANELGVGHRFHLLGLRADIANVLRSADLFVLSSLSEGVPMALLEAMLAEVPIVATAVGDVAPTLGDGAAGVLVSPGDSAALASGMAQLLSDPPAARRLAAIAARRAAEGYTLDTMLQRYESIYATLLAAR